MKNELDYVYIPVRLFDLSCKKGSDITLSHLTLYGTFLKRANWSINPMETGRLNIAKLLLILGWKKAYFFRILNDLIPYEFTVSRPISIPMLS